MADVVDSKEQLRFRAMCDERISFPFEELRPFEDVYAKLEPYVQSSSYVEVKVAWRCNTEQWRWAEVEPAQAGPLYRKLNYSDEAIRAFGLDPDLPVRAPGLGAAAVGADSPLMEYPDQPRPPITIENVNCHLLGQDGVWAGLELGHPMGDYQQGEGCDDWWLHVQALPRLLETGPWCNSPGPNHWTEQGQEAAHHG